MQEGDDLIDSAISFWRTIHERSEEIRNEEPFWEDVAQVSQDIVLNFGEFPEPAVLSKPINLL